MAVTNNAIPPINYNGILKELDLDNELLLNK